ncbi:hypothetical protein [Candidatus Poriferisodalis sp.]
MNALVGLVPPATNAVRCVVTDALCHLDLAGLDGIGEVLPRRGV